MSDPYVWIDPFAEIEGLKRVAAYSREEGRREVLSVIERNYGDDLPEAVKRASHYLAEKMAEEFLRPHVLRHRLEYDEYQARREHEIEVVSDIMQPLVAYSTHDGQFTIAMQSRAEASELIASFHTNRPFQYSVTMSGYPRRRW